MKKFKFNYSQKYFLGRFLQTIVLFLGCFGTLNAQTLTISTSGQTTSPGTNWSITGTTLTVTGTANIRASVIETALSSGSLTIVGNSSSFTVNQSEAISSTQSGSNLIIGSNTNTGNIILNANLTVAGAISIFGGDVQLNENITSTATGDLFFQGLSNTWSVRLAAGKTIEKTSGTGLLTMQGNGRINNSTSVGSIIASGSARLDVVIINEMDAVTASAGTYNVSTGNITTNGGHLWISAGAKTRIWNGLTVGSTGIPGNTNYNGIDVTGNISTNGGDILLWAFVGSNARSNGYGDITALSSNRTISSGSGDITLMTRYNDFVNSTPDISISTTGTLTLAPASGSSFDVDLSFAGTTTSGTFTGSGGMDGIIIQNVDNLSGLVIGSYNGTGVSGDSPYTSTNSANVILGSAISIAGPIEVYGGNIYVNENLNTTAGTTSGNILLKGAADVILAASRSITTSGAPVILWANSDNEAANGSIALRNGSSIVTGSGSVAGGHVWLGGGSDGTTWNGMAVGSGYAVPGTSFTPSNGGGAPQAGIYLERNSISSFGGNIKIAGDGAATARGIVSYGNTININAGSGKIELDGQVTSTATGNRGGILFGLHDNTIISTVNISSSANSGDAITINGIGRGTEDAIGLSGTLNITSSGGGNIVMNGNALGSGRGIVAGNYYHGVMNVFANSGNIILNGNTKAVQVAAAFTSGLTTGPSKLNIGQGGAITSSSSDVFITADNIALAADGIAINSSGKVTIEPSSNSFANAITFPITNLSIANTITGLTLGKSTNTANITMAASTTVAGPITAYGGTINLGVGVELATTSANGDIALYANNGFTTTATSGTTRGRIITSGGDILINADSDNNNSGTLNIDWLTIDGNTGDVTMEGAIFDWDNSSGVAYPEFYGTGNLTFKTTTSSNYDFNLGWVALFQNKSSITIGKVGSTSAGDIIPCSNCNNTATNYTGKTIQVNGPITINGSSIALNQQINATNSNITLSASSAITQTAAIAGNGLALLGAGTVTLNNTSNAINILAGGTSNARIGALSYTNSKALTIGSVNPTGIYSSGDIYLATTNGGNINLNHPINTTSTSADAIRLFADLGQTAGTGTGGQILVNGGSVSVGSGGYAKLFSGNEASSFGLNELTAGSSFRKYNFATATSNDNTALGISTAGTYAIYRDTEYKLTNLTVGTGTLAPTFASDVFGYSVSLSTTTSSFAFTPTANAGTIHISKNGGSFASHTSGTAYTDNSPDPVSTRYVIQVRDGGVVKSSYTLHLLVNQSTVPNASAWESSWIPVFQAANFDPNDDQQAVAETDLVGNASNPMLMAQQRTVSVGNTVQKVYYFRTRLGNTGSPKTSAYFGLDVNKDLKVDMVVQADLKARTPYVSFHLADPRKDGSGPSQTAWLNSSNNSNIERRLNTTASVITNYPVSTTASARGSNGVTTLDLDSPVGGQNTGTDTWLEFAFTEASFQSFTNDALGTARSGSDVNGIVYFTSTSQTANGDIAGIDDRTADLSKTWAELGIVLESSFGAMTSDEVDPPVVVVQSSSSLNGNGTIYGTWNGLQICNTSPGSSLTVTVNGQSFYYNVSGQTNTITLINGGGWSLNFTGFAPGTYTVQAFIENGCTGQTGNGTGTLLISEVLVNDLITTETKPTLTGRSSLNNQQVRIRIYNSANNLLGERMVTTSATGTWALDLDTTNINALSPANYYVEAYQVNGTSIAIDTGSLTVLQDIYPEIAISSVQLNSSNTYVVSGTSSYRTRAGESLRIEIVGPSSASSPTVYTYTIGSSPGITINSTTGAWSVDFAALNTSDLGLYEVTATINYDIHQTGADVRTASDFATFEALTLLPVELTSFDVSCQEQQQLLVMSWSTSQELNNAYFTIKESADGMSWTSLAQIPSLGNAFHTQSYTWETASANRAMFFELSQTDIDGQEKILSQRMVNCNSNTTQGFNLQVYPNPNNGSFTIALNQNVEVAFEVLDVLGQTITSGSVNGQTTIQNLAKGLYFVKVNFNGQTWTEKIIVH